MPRICRNYIDPPRSYLELLPHAGYPGMPFLLLLRAYLFTVTMILQSHIFAVREILAPVSALVGCRDQDQSYRCCR